MTSSDDDLRKLLARELKAEAARFTPAEDGLSRIRGRLRSRPSFPLWGGLRVDAERYGYRLRYVAAEALAWLFSLARRGWQVPSGRFKTTPAAQEALAAGGVSARGRHSGAGAVSGLRATYQRVGTVGLRLVVAFAAVCLFAGTALAVPGVRNAIGSIASSSSGGTGHGRRDRRRDGRRDRRRDGRRDRRHGRPAAGRAAPAATARGPAGPGRCRRPHWPAGNGKVHGQSVADVDVRESDQDRPQGEPDDAGHSRACSLGHADDRAAHHTAPPTTKPKKWAPTGSANPTPTATRPASRHRLGQPGDPELVRDVQAVHRPDSVGVCSSAAGLRLSDQAAVRGVSVGALGAVTRPAEPDRRGRRRPRAPPQVRPIREGHGADHHETDHPEADHHETDHHDTDHHEADHSQAEHPEADHHETEHPEADHHEDRSTTDRALPPRAPRARAPPAALRRPARATGDRPPAPRATRRAARVTITTTRAA